MAQPGKVLAAKSKALSSIPGSHVIEGEHQSPKRTLTSTHTCSHSLTNECRLKFLKIKK